MLREIKFLDADHDGKISREEWDTLDVNRDGKVSQEELFNLREKANLSNNNAASESDVKTGQEEGDANPTINVHTLELHVNAGARPEQEVLATNQL